MEDASVQMVDGQKKMEDAQASETAGGRLGQDRVTAPAEAISLDASADARMKASEPSEAKPEPRATAAVYADDSVDARSRAFAEGRRVVLFFHAAWCPYCRNADAAFRARIAELPEDIALFKVDYDTAKDLKLKYGISSQHTFVQIDAGGNAIAKWVSGDVDMLNAQVGAK